MSDKPFWYPKLCDAEYCERLREDYPDNADWSDEELIDYYNDGRKYSITWDHIGDAYEEYEPLADSYLQLERKLSIYSAALKAIEEHEHCNADKTPWPYPQEDPYSDTMWRNGHHEGHRCCAAIARKAREEAEKV